MKRLAFTSGALVLVLCAFQANAGPVTFTQIGSPQWEPVDGNLFSAPIGTAGDGYAAFVSGQTANAILPPPHYVVNNGQIVPGTPENPPFTSDIGNGVTAQGFKKGPNFSPSDFSNGNGVWVAFMLVPGPGADQGVSPDFPSTNGPLIPTNLFPLTQAGVTKRNGSTFDSAWDAQYQDINKQLGLMADIYEGSSKLPIFLAESSDFGSGGPNGSYSSTWTIKDTNGDGWQISASYTVGSGTQSVPLPPAVWAGLIGIVMAIGARFWLLPRLHTHR